METRQQSVVATLNEQKPASIWAVDSFETLCANYESIYSSTSFTKNHSTRFFRWLFGVDDLIIKHTPNKIWENKKNNGICHSIQATLDDLKQINAHRNRLTRWLIDLNPLIAQCEMFLKKAHLTRGKLFLKTISDSASECKKSTTAKIKQEIREGVHDALSRNLLERSQLITVLTPQETKELIPTHNINYFNPKPNIFRFVHPRVSGGKRMSYKHLKEEIQESLSERERLTKERPSGYNVNYIDQDPSYKSWSDAVDDCEARESYSRAMINEKNPEIIFDDKGKPSITQNRPR